MGKNEMINSTNGFMVPLDFNFAEVFSEELDGMDISFDRIGTPGANGTTFEVPGDNPGETDSVKEFSAVILYHHPMSFLFTEAYNGQRTEPACKTYDGVKGIGTPGGTCRDCPFNKFGSGINGGKLCRNKRRVYLLRENEVLPVLISIPTGSLKNFYDYVKRLVAKGIKPSMVVTKFSIEKVQNGGPVFAQLRFSFERLLTTEETECVANLAAQVKDYAARAVIEEQPEEYVDQETGEVLGGF